MFEKLTKNINKINPLKDGLLLKDRVFDCSTFDSNELHPFYKKGFIFPNGMVEIEGSGTLLTVAKDGEFSDDNIDKTLFFFDSAVTSAEIVNDEGQIFDMETVTNGTVFSRFMLRNLKPHGITKIIFKDLR